MDSETILSLYKALIQTFVLLILLIKQVTSNMSVDFKCSPAKRIEKAAKAVRIAKDAGSSVMSKHRAAPNAYNTRSCAIMR